MSVDMNSVRVIFDKHAVQYTETKYKSIVDDFGRLCIADLLQPNITASDETQVLELAAGEGNFSRDLADKLGAGTFWVTDLSTGMQRITKENLTGKVNFNFRQLNALHLESSFSSGSMDLVIFRNAENYFDEKEKIQLFKQIYKVLKPGGYFLYCPSSFGEDYTNQVHVPTKLAEKIFLAYWARFMLTCIQSRHLCEERMLLDLAIEKFTCLAKVKKSYEWNIDNYSSLKHEMAAGIQMWLSLSGYNLSLFKLLSRFFVPYPFRIILNQTGYLLKKTEEGDSAASNAMKA